MPAVECHQLSSSDPQQQDPVDASNSSTSSVTNPMIQLASASEHYAKLAQQQQQQQQTLNLKQDDPFLQYHQNQQSSISAPLTSTHSSFVDSDAAFASGAAPTTPINMTISNHSHSQRTSASGLYGSQHDENQSSNQNQNVPFSFLSSQSETPCQPSPTASSSSVGSTGEGFPAKKKRKPNAAVKQHQLPMFLTKTYHMIEKCDPEVATWSEHGDNFVVKNVEKFASSVLPQYFKHSNFSSFARQLNFYGFRKLKAEPILTADYDSRTASYVRFFHDKFQKDKPELLVHIKRATKSDVQSKDDVDTMRAEIQHLNDVIVGMQNEFDKRLADMYVDMNMKYQAIYQNFELLQSQIFVHGASAAALGHHHQQQQQQNQQQQQQQLQNQQQQAQYHPQQQMELKQSSQHQQNLNQIQDNPIMLASLSGTNATTMTTSTTTQNGNGLTSFSIPTILSHSMKKKGTDMMQMLSQATMTLKSPALPPSEGHNVNDNFSLK